RRRRRRLAGPDRPGGRGRGRNLGGGARHSRSATPRRARAGRGAGLAPRRGAAAARPRAAIPQRPGGTGGERRDGGPRPGPAGDDGVAPGVRAGCGRPRPGADGEAGAASPSAAAPAVDPLAAAVSTAVLRAARWRALGSDVDVRCTDGVRLDDAAAAVEAELAAIDLACSRFRADSELSRVDAARGRTVPVSPLLAEAVGVALRAAALTGGLVDPTVGAAMRAIGYDVDFASLPPEGPALALVSRPVPGWRRVELDAGACRLRVPAGVMLDLGATAKALAADRAARAAAAAAGTGVLVSLG